MANRDTFILANANRCTVYPQHRMVFVRRDEAWMGDLFECACGEQKHKNSDESQFRALSGHPIDVLRGELGI